jgi:FMN phosphatase YigB (HAD superfamily)
MVNHHLVYLSRQCSSTPDSFSKEFLNKNNVILLEHPPYTADLVPAVFYLFPRLKSAWKECRFHVDIYIIKNAMEELKRLSQNGFQERFQHVYSR